MKLSPSIHSSLHEPVDCSATAQPLADAATQGVGVQVIETYPLSGASVRCKRRDLRRGTPPPAVFSLQGQAQTYCVTHLGACIASTGMPLAGNERAGQPAQDFSCTSWHQGVMPECCEHSTGAV